MPGFFDRLKSGAEKAAFEADRLRRVNQAQGVLKGIQRELDTIVAAWGRQVLALYDAGALRQPELLAAGPQVDELRHRIAEQEAEIQSIREEEMPEQEPEVAAPPPPVQAQQPLSPAPVPSQEAPVPDALEAPAPEPVVAEETPPPPPPPPPVKLRYCANCGAVLPAGVKFCMECGTKVEA